MGQILGILFITLFSIPSFAALAPNHQNSEDLSVIIDFIQKHDKVMSTLTSIDFTDFVVYFDDGCKAVFMRDEQEKPLGLVGPADPLEFKLSTCNLDE